MQNKILLFGDGASKGNPGSAGWGSLIVFPRAYVIELGGSASHATNNEMELQAIIAGLTALSEEPGDLLILTDSSYVISGVSSWMARWNRNGWLTTTGTAVRNKPLWQELETLLARRAGRAVTWQHVRGHSGILANERVDRIAHGFATGARPELYHGSLGGYSFDPYDLAAKGVAGTAAKKSRSKQAAYCYLSLVGGVLANHKTWAECEARVKGQKGAKFKKALSSENEQEIIAEWRRMAPGIK